LIVAPEGLSRFYLHDSEGSHGKKVPIGATWMTREDRENEITDYVEFLDAVLDEVSEESGGEIARLTVLGFSQGAHTVCRWLAAGEATVERLILWGAYLPDDFDPERGPDRLRSAELILVRGLLDHYISEEAHASQEERLEGLGIPFKTITHAGGHELDSALLRQIADAAG
jgi:predicted esterase